MGHLTKAAKQEPGALTIWKGVEATQFIAGANLLQTATVFDGDTIAIIALDKKDVVEVTVFKEGCRTYQSRTLTRAEWLTILSAVSKIVTGSKPL
jgi:hypothetical protein